MRKKKLIYAFQFPHPSYLTSNIPLSLGYLSSYLQQTDIATDVEMEIAHSKVNDLMGDSQIIKQINKKMPDMLAFSVYPWNIERTISIAQKVKLQSKGKIIIVFGGPEVFPGNPMFSQNAGADFLISGEGEIPFIQLVNHSFFGNFNDFELFSVAFWDREQYVWNTTKNPPVDLNCLPSPYLRNIIPLEGKTAVNIFSFRGCPFRCKYCQWKAGKKIRKFPEDQVFDELEWALNHRAPAIYISDAALNISPHFEKICEFLEKNKPLKKSIRSFVHLSTLTRNQAFLLGRSGIRGVEVGLQNIENEVNELISRRFDMEKFEKGYALLNEIGVDCVADIIIGLPLSNKQSILKTINYVRKLGMEFILFHLSVPCGSELFKEKENYRLKIQKAPPYYVFSTNVLKTSEINQIYSDYFNNSADKDYCQDIEYPEKAIQICRGISRFCDLKNPLDQDSCNITDWIIWVKGSEIFEIDHQFWTQKSASKLSIWFLADKFYDNWITFFYEFIDYFTTYEKFSKLNIHFQIKCIEPKIGNILKTIDDKISHRNHFLFNRDHFIKHFPKKLRNDCGHACLISENKNFEKGTVIEKIKTLCLIQVNSSNHLQNIDLNDSRFYGFCISFDRTMDWKTVAELLELIRDKAENPSCIYFLDPVIQRIWLQKIRSITVDPMNRKMIIFRKDQIKFLNYTDYELAWDALFQWGLTKNNEQISDLDHLDEIIKDRISTKIQKNVTA